MSRNRDSERPHQGDPAGPAPLASVGAAALRSRIRAGSCMRARASYIPAMPHTSTEIGLTAPRPLAVTYRATASIKPDSRNARTHPKRQVDQIIASIREFGFTNPILIDHASIVIAGHGRLLAAKSMGLAEVPTIELVGLNEAQKRALRLADNKIALNAGWDLDLLKVELGELSSPDLDLTITGFSTGELDLLLRAGEDPEDDAIPPVPAIARTRAG